MHLDINGYSIESTRSEVQSRDLVNRVFQKNLPNYHAYRDNRRTLSARFEINEDRFILKISRGRNRRLWERVLSFFRGSDVARIYQGMLALEKMKIPGTRPVLMAQKIVAGMTIDSFLIYEYLEGRTCTEDDSELIAKIILNLHELGYMRRDIHLLNFLMTSNGQIGLIDFRLSKPRMLKKIQFDFELIQMLKSIPSTREYIPQARLTTYNLKIAMAFYSIKTCIRKIKNTTKQLFINYKTTR